MRDQEVTHSANDVRIVTLDTLSQRHVDIVEDMFHGDGTCTLANMEVACFASERCNCASPKGTGARTMALAAHNTHVAMRGDDVIAFATVMPMARCDFLQMATLPQNGTFVSNLCVHTTRRSNGFGGMLLRHLMQTYATRGGEGVYVSIRTPDTTAPPQVATHMRKRSQELVALYQHMSFRVVETTPRFHVMHCRPP